MTSMTTRRTRCGSPICRESPSSCRAATIIITGRRRIPVSLIPRTRKATTLQFPDQFSLVYAGAVSDQVGGWLQLTYNGQAGSVGVDNIDIRYSDHTADNKWVWGITANNYVTFQDVWNGIGSYTIPNFNTVTLWSGGVAGAGTSGPILNALGPGSCCRYRRLCFL